MGDPGLSHLSASVSPPVGADNYKLNSRMSGGSVSQRLRLKLRKARCWADVGICDDWAVAMVTGAPCLVANISNPQKAASPLCSDILEAGTSRV